MSNLDEIERHDKINRVRRFRQNLIEKQMRAAYYSGLMQGLGYGFILFAFIYLTISPWI